MVWLGTQVVTGKSRASALEGSAETDFRRAGVALGAVAAGVSIAEITPASLSEDSGAASGDTLTDLVELTGRLALYHARQVKIPSRTKRIAPMAAIVT